MPWYATVSLRFIKLHQGLSLKSTSATITTATRDGDAGRSPQRRAANSVRFPAWKPYARSARRYEKPGSKDLASLDNA